MALSFKSAANNQTSGSVTTVTCTLPVASAAGDVVMVFGVGGGSNPASLTLSNANGDTYTDSGLGLLTETWASAKARIGVFLNPTVGSTQYTVTIPSADTFVEVMAWCVTGFVATPTIDAKVQASGNSNAADSGSSGTLAQAEEAAIGVVICASGASAAGSGWSTGGTNINDGITAFGDIGEHRITAATTAINATASLSGTQDWSAYLLTIRDAAAAAAKTPWSPWPQLGPTLAQ